MSADWATGSGWHGRGPHGGSVADGADGFRGHVARPLGGPLVGDSTPLGVSGSGSPGCGDSGSGVGASRPR